MRFFLVITSDLRYALEIEVVIYRMNYPFATLIESSRINHRKQDSTHHLLSLL